MPIARVQMPDGRIARLEVPDGTTPEQVTAFVKSQAQPRERVQPQGGPPENYNPTDEMSGGERVLAGIGRGMTQAARGVGQLVGAVSDEDIANAQELDAPLLNTTGGSAGNILGTAAAFAPAALIPGANNYAGAAIIGGVGSAAYTPGGAKERLTAGGFGALGGLAGKGAGDLLAKGSRAGISALASSGARQAAVNAPRDAVLAQARQAGMVVPPSTANPTLLNKTVEGFAGKLSTAQKASNINAPKVDALVREELGMAADAPITADSLAAIRKQAGQVYQQLKGTGTVTADTAYDSAIDNIAKTIKSATASFPKLGKTNMHGQPIDEIGQLANGLKQREFDAGGAVDAISVLRDNADAAYRAGNNALGRANKEGAEALEAMLERHLQKIGATDALPAYRAARQLIAKSYTVQKALEGGNVSATKLAQALKAGKPLSGKLKEVAEFGQYFPKAAQSPSKVGTVAGTSPLDWAVGVAGSLHNPLLLAGVAARPVARNALLSRPYQAISTTPKYGPNALSRGAVNAMENRLTRESLSRLGAAYPQQQ